MFYSMILPAVILLSLSLVVIFLVKKAPVVRKAEEAEEEIFKEEEKNQKKIKEKFCIFCGERLLPSLKKTIVFIWEKSKVTIVEFFKSLFSKKKKENKKREKEQGVKDSTLEKINSYKEKEEKPVRPMISEKVTNPRNKAEMKDRFEEILIERVAANPKDVEAYERLGEYYLEIGELNDSKECFKQVIKLNPANRRAKFKIERIKKELKK